MTILATVVNRPAEGEPVLVCSIEPGSEASKPEANISMMAEVQNSLPQMEDEDGKLREVMLNTMDMEELVEMAKNAEKLRSELSEEEFAKLSASWEGLQFDVSQELSAEELQDVANMLGITVTEDLLPNGELEPVEMKNSSVEDTPQR